MDDYDNAIAAYEKSLAIDPEGVTPLQNMAVAYAYKKEFRKAIDTYKKLGALNAQDPEIFYGIGKIYAFDLGDLEQGLDNLCTAYVLYVQKKSPYRTDAEKLMQMIYAQMKQNGKEDAFDNILKAHNINSH
jgi:tetratricopeptide (TPR) repeat protein